MSTLDMFSKMYRFKWKSTTVELHFLFVCVVTLFFLLDQTGTSLVAVWVALMHEMGHIIALVALGSPPKRLSFHLFGIKLEQASSLLPAAREAILLLSGSAVNFLTASLLFLATQSSPSRDLFVGMHLAVGVMNLLPLRGLDGGGLLELLLQQWFPMWHGDRILSILQLLFLVAFTGWAGYYAVCVQVSATMLLVVCYLWLSLLRS